MVEKSREFKGRVIMAGRLSGEAVVSRKGFNTLASFQKDTMAGKKVMKCSDQNNADIFGKTLTGKILCLPKTIGSTTGGMVLQTVASMGAAPAAMLFSEAIDSLAAAGVILADVWNGNRIVAIDNLGTEFLAYVQQGQKVDIFDDGKVIVHE
jgi:predicted aconitase with swiveling domain